MKGKKLKVLIETGTLVQAPGVYDPLTAKIVEAQGFDAVYMTGFGTSAGVFGLPDIGLLTLTEMVSNAARIADGVEIPLIADADTGYGNPINVIRTVKEFEKAGAAAIHIEDQTWPKRCGHMTGKSIIPVAEMLGKIKAAVDTRQDPDFQIIVRTDAIATEGFEQAIDRANRYAEAGADILFIEAPTDREQVELIPKRLPGKRLLLNLAPLTPNLSKDEIENAGYAIVIYPGVCLGAAISACTEAVKRVKETGKQPELGDSIQSFTDLNDFLGVSNYRDLEQKYKIGNSQNR